MVAGPSKEPDRNQKPSTSTSTSTCTCTSTISVFVDVHVDVLVDVDVFFRLTMEVKHTPENVKLRLPPRQSRGISQRISPHFSPGFLAKRRRRSWLQGARREDSAGVPYCTSRSPTERNAADMPGSTAAVETW